MLATAVRTREAQPAARALRRTRAAHAQSAIPPVRFVRRDVRLVALPGPTTGTLATILDVARVALPSGFLPGSEVLWRNGARLKRVASAPDLGEYTISGRTATLGGIALAPLTVDDLVWADVTIGSLAGFAPVVGADVTILDDTHLQLPFVPSPRTERVFVNGLNLWRVASAPGLNEYTIADDLVVLGAALPLDAVVLADGFIAGTALAPQLHQPLVQLDDTHVQLAATPLADSEALYVGGIRLRRVPAFIFGINEYTLAGDIATLGWTEPTAAEAGVSDFYL